MRTPATDGSLECVREQVELRLAPDQWCGHRHGRGLRAIGSADDAPGGDGLDASPDVDRIDFLDLDAVERKAAGSGADQDLARRRRLLQPSGQVDGLAGCEGRVGGLHDHLAGFDADARLQLELLDAFQDPDAGAHRPLRVVLVGLCHAEGGEHGVARELLHDPAVRHHAMGDQIEEPRHPPPDDLGVGGGDERGRIDQIDEQHGGELALHT